MSETKTHTGTLVEIKEFRGMDKEIVIPQLQRLGYDVDEDGYSSSDEIFIFNNRYFKLVNHFQYDVGQSFDFSKKNDDGSIELIVQFYNGGTCLSEIIEEILEKQVDEE